MATRRPASSEVTLQGRTGSPVIARIADISTCGCNIRTGDEAPRLGQFVALRFAGTDTAQAIVRWVRGDRAGLEFLRPIPADLVEGLGRP